MKTNTVEETVVENEVEEIVHPEEEPEKNEVFVNCAVLNVRSYHDKSSDVVCKVKLNEALLVEEDLGEWLHIYTKAGIEGYILSEFARKND